MDQILNLIDGRLREPMAGQFFPVIEPATGVVYAQAPDSGSADIDRAVAAAQRAFPAWSGTPALERAACLVRLAELIERDSESLARAESIDTGKPITLARTVDLPRSAASCRFFASAIGHTSSALHTMDDGSLNYTLRSPRGVAGLIAPWNLPLYLLTWKIAPAIATGNTCVCKPSELSPMTAFLLSELVIEAGIPPGVINIVHGTGAGAGSPLVEHPGVPTLSFTGGTATGRTIARIAAPMFKRYALELGGKNPNVIFADADMDEAAMTACRAAFTNQGQICLCGSRVYVEESVFEPFVEQLVKHAKAMRVGDPLDEETQIGSVIARHHLEKIESMVKLARELGGEIRCGGRQAETVSERCKGGSFYEPTVITGLASDCAVEQQEIFGPVVSVSPFATEAQAIELANGTEYGLSAMVWTSDLSRTHRVAAQIDSGVVWINCWMVRDMRTPFGGMKQSGVGREGGDEALRFYTEAKNVCVKIQPEDAS